MTFLRSRSSSLVPRVANVSCPLLSLVVIAWGAGACSSSSSSPGPSGAETGGVAGAAGAAGSSGAGAFAGQASVAGNAGAGGSKGGAGANGGGGGENGGGVGTGTGGTAGNGGGGAGGTSAGGASVGGFHDCEPTWTCGGPTCERGESCLGQPSWNISEGCAGRQDEEECTCGVSHTFDDCLIWFNSGGTQPPTGLCSPGAVCFDSLAPKTTCDDENAGCPRHCECAKGAYRLCTTACNQGCPASPPSAGDPCDTFGVACVYGADTYSCTASDLTWVGPIAGAGGAGGIGGASGVGGAAGIAGAAGVGGASGGGAAGAAGVGGVAGSAGGG